MPLVVAVPELLAASTDLSRLASALGVANAAAAASTTAVGAAALDEVSLAIATLFSEYASGYQDLSSRAETFHQHFLRALTAGAEAYQAAEGASASPLALVLDAVNAPVRELTGRPLIGNGANAAPGSGLDGAAGGVAVREWRRRRLRRGVGRSR